MFFMHLANDSGDIPDDEGVDLPDDAAARQRAVTIMRELIAEDIRAGRNLVHLSLSVIENGGRKVLSLSAVASLTGLD